MDSSSTSSNFSGGGWRSLLSWPPRVPPLTRADAKKAGVLALLVVALGGIWVIKLSRGGEPNHAAAYTVPPTSSLLSDPSFGDATTRPGHLHGISGEAADLQKWLDGDIPVVLNRNLFAIKLDYFPMDGNRASQGSRTGADETFWDQLAKSISSEADQQERRNNLVQNLRQQADRLQLLSTVMGPKPKAMINGEFVGEGDVIATFRVFKIEARRVIVEREGIRLELTMK